MTDLWTPCNRFLDIHFGSNDKDVLFKAMRLCGGNRKWGELKGSENGIQDHVQTKRLEKGKGSSQSHWLWAVNRKRVFLKKKKKVLEAKEKRKQHLNYWQVHKLSQHEADDWPSSFLTWKWLGMVMIVDRMKRECICHAKYKSLI